MKGLLGILLTGSLIFGFNQDALANSAAHGGGGHGGGHGEKKAEAKKEEAPAAEHVKKEPAPDPKEVEREKRLQAQRQIELDKMNSQKIYTPLDFKRAVDTEVTKRLTRIQGANMANFSRELMSKEEDVKRREESVKKQEEQLRINEQLFEKKIKEFEVLQQKVIGCIDKNDKESSGRIDNTVKIVSNMKPAVAAQMLSVQESELAVQILAKMDPLKASKIFNLMDKDTSSKLQKLYMQMKK